MTQCRTAAFATIFRNVFLCLRLCRPHCYHETFQTCIKHFPIDHHPSSPKFGLVARTFGPIWPLSYGILPGTRTKAQKRRKPQNSSRQVRHNPNPLTASLFGNILWHLLFGGLRLWSGCGFGFGFRTLLLALLKLFQGGFFGGNPDGFPLSLLLTNGFQISTNNGPNRLLCLPGTLLDLVNIRHLLVQAAVRNSPSNDTGIFLSQVQLTTFGIGEDQDWASRLH
mmetsp:Transcript_44244/g.71992  ORF Transcript_44244/g.71992 Transcript_44244/m.71992 type:complete len:224 (-) Transcript_44244:121-792(-)